MWRQLRGRDVRDIREEDSDSDNDNDNDNDGK